MTRKDAGKYVLIATNKSGKDIADTHISVLGKITDLFLLVVFLIDEMLQISPIDFWHLKLLIF